MLLQSQGIIHLNLFFVCLQITLSSFNKYGAQAAESNHLFRRTANFLKFENNVYFRINKMEDQISHVTTFPDVPLIYDLQSSSGPIRSLELIAGPVGFNCFLWVPISVSRDYFVSPILRITAVQQQLISDLTIQFAVNREARLEYAQGLGFPAHSLIHYRPGDSDNDNLVFIETENGWNMLRLSFRNMVQDEGTTMPVGDSQDPYRNIQRVAVMTGSALKEVECVLRRDKQPFTSQPFNSKKPLLSSFSQAKWITCFEESMPDSPLSLPEPETSDDNYLELEFPPRARTDPIPSSQPEPEPEPESEDGDERENEIEDGSNPETDSQSSSTASSPWWKFWE